MAWTPAPPPSAAWAKDTTTTSSWDRPAAPNDTWDIIGHGLHRIIEAGGHRITEDGQYIRIIERRDVAWTFETASQSLWTVET